MLREGDNEETLGKLHIQWLISLEAYLKQLQQIDSISRQFQANSTDLSINHHITSLRNRILMQKNVVSAIAEEVKMFSNFVLSKRDKKSITMSDIIQNNRLRDKILKVEQNVLMLRYETNQLLSRAS